MVDAQISLYPLRQEHLGPGIRAITETLSASGLAPEIGRMSTHVRAPVDVLFEALKKAFSEASETGDVVMSVTFSNACPQRCQAVTGRGASEVDDPPPRRQP